MPQYDPELIHIMRNALEEVMGKSARRVFNFDNKSVSRRDYSQGCCSRAD